LGLSDTTELRRKLVEGIDVDLPGAVRMTIGIFNNREEIDILLEELRLISEKKWDADYSALEASEICREVVLNPY
jgi:hypothetical protein